MIEVPASFRAMPRWWSAGTEWLDALPSLVEGQCARWSLRPDGGARHGSNALVVPVRRGSERFALRVTPPGADVGDTVTALRFWAGRGTVELVEADPERGALLLEWLGAGSALSDLPIDKTLPVLGRLARRLAVPTPLTVRSTGEVATEDAATWRQRWISLSEPVTPRLFNAALDAAESVLEPVTPDLAVDADLHDGQVLAGDREPWLVVDPVLLRGDIGYDFGRILWTRLDELGSDREVDRWLSVLTDAAEVDADRSRKLVVLRSMSYLLWGLEHGLTEDPPRCVRLLEIFADEH